MKTAYELAMERLSKTSPTVKLSNDQKKRIAALEGEYKAKIADREIAAQAQKAKAAESEDAEAVQRCEEQLATERRSLQAELEQKKEQIRQERPEPR